MQWICGCIEHIGKKLRLMPNLSVDRLKYLWSRDSTRPLATVLAALLAFNKAS